MSDKIDFTGIEEIQEQDVNQDLKAAEAAEGPLSEQDLKGIDESLKLEEEYGDQSLEAGLLGAARGLTFGVSDQALVKSGIYSQEDLRELKKRNEIASLTGDIAGTVGPALLTGGTSLAARGAQVAGKGVLAAQAAGKAAEKAFASALASEGKKSIAREIVRKTAPQVIGSATEGAIYGLGQLVSEDALGNAELNAENIISAAGTGALLGGITRGVFEAPKALIPAGKKVAGKATSKLGDPVESALDIYGVTPTQRAKLKQSAPGFVEELPEWTAKKAKLGYFTKTGTLKDNVVKLRQEAGEKIGETMKKIDDVAAANPGIMPDSATTYGKIAKKVDDTIQEFANVPGFKAQIRPVREIRDEFLNIAKSGKPFKASDLHQMRQKIDQLIKFDKAPGTYTLKEKALNNVRFALNDEIQKIAEEASKKDVVGNFGNLLKDLLEANKDFSYASRIIPSIEKKVEREAAKRGIFNLTDLVTGGAVGAVDPGAMGIAVGAKKLLESDLRRRATILSSIERQNQKNLKTISKGISEFFEKAPAAAARIPTKAILSSSLSLSPQDNKTKPKSKKQAFENISERLSTLVSEPEQVQDMVSKRTLHVSKIAPNITTAATATAIRGVEFLYSKLPKPSASTSLQQFTKREFQPSELQLSKFERYVEAVENPMSAIDDLKSGTLTREAAEAIQVVYPQMFNQMQETTLENLTKTKEPVPYNKRLQLAILLDLTTDPSLESENISGLQANLSQPSAQLPGGPTAARADSLDMADRRETKANKIAQR